MDHQTALPQLFCREFRMRNTSMMLTDKGRGPGWGTREASHFVYQAGGSLTHDDEMNLGTKHWFLVKTLSYEIGEGGTWLLAPLDVTSCLPDSCCETRRSVRQQHQKQVHARGAPESMLFAQSLHTASWSSHGVLWLPIFVTNRLITVHGYSKIDARWRPLQPSCLSSRDPSQSLKHIGGCQA